MKKIFIAIVLVFLISVAVWEINKITNPVYTSAGPNVVINKKLVQVETVDDFIKQTQGLSDRSSLGENNGMLFVFSDKQVRRFWMKNMKFPLDIIWIEDNAVVKIDKNLPPAGDKPTISYDSSIPVNFVLEVNAGWADKNKIKIGNLVKINL
jgi:hypothetical protein